jgi:FMN-dependent NADH-azoreductase
MNLLHIVSSPRKERSASLEVANAFIAAWKGKHADAHVDTLNVWETELLPFDKAALDAKYAGIAGTKRTPEQEAAWAQIAELGNRFHRAQILLFSVPMWNFGIPYRLKHLIDVISQKDVLFTYDERGIVGMLGGRQMVVIAARGAVVSGDAMKDHQVDYLRTWAHMVGIPETHEIVMERTLFGPDAEAAARAEARAKAVALAGRL